MNRIAGAAVLLFPLFCHPAPAALPFAPDMDPGYGKGSAPACTDDDDDASPSRTSSIGGLAAVRLTALEQKHTGIAAATLGAQTHVSELVAAGRIVDVQPLLDLRSQYHSARGEFEIAEAAARASGKGVERLRVLHGENSNISARQLQEAEALAASDQARRTAAGLRMKDVHASAVQQWGETLVELALDPDSEIFGQIVSQRELLVLVTLLPGDTLPAGAITIHLGAADQRSSAREATLIAPAPQTGAVTQGETWFYRTGGDRLRIGMRLDAWIPRDDSSASGVLVPDSALIWHANRLWVYVRQGPEHFVRKPLADFEEVRNGWFVRSGLSPGESVVVSGAQMLYAEEFRSAIPSEDEARE